MLSLADVIAKKKFVKDEPTKYVSTNIRNKARIYTVIHDTLHERFSQFKFTFFVKDSSKKCIRVTFQSPNNSLIASINLDKNGLQSRIKKSLFEEQLITEDTELVLIPKLG